MKPILDACCGSKMFWFDKENENVVFMDKQRAKEEINFMRWRKLSIKPTL